MQESEIEQAERRLADAWKRLESASRPARQRWLAGIATPEDLAHVMELDVEVERAAACLDALKGAHRTP